MDLYHLGRNNSAKSIKKERDDYKRIIENMTIANNALKKSRKTIPLRIRDLRRQGWKSDCFLKIRVRIRDLSRRSEDLDELKRFFA